MRVTAAVVFVYAGLAVPATAQAFGVFQGMPFEQLSFADSQRFSFVPPDPNPNFDTYQVNATEAAGVCGVSGTASGLAPRERDARFARVHNALTEKYGSPVEFDPAGMSKFEDAEGVTIQLVSWRSMLILGYTFPNSDECQGELTPFADPNAKGL